MDLIMNIKALNVFKELLKKGYISRIENPNTFADYRDNEVRDELDIMKRELDFDLHDVNGRVYLIPLQENELFSQGIADIRSSLGSDAVNLDVYLNNYISMYLIYLFFHGENATPESRESITVNEFIKELDHNMRQATDNKDISEENEKRYGINFIKIAETWLGKIYGEADSKRLDDRVGFVRKAFIKLRDEELFVIESNDMIKPTQKLKDIMPYYISQSRVEQINNIFKGKDEEDADNIEGKNSKFFL